MKELSKVPSIKKHINLDPRHPGTLSKQKYSYKNGRKSNTYYLWQSSILGEKKSIRVPKEDVAQVKSLIKSAKESTKVENSEIAATLKSYRKALDRLIERNREIRSKNGEGNFKEKKSNDKKIEKLEKKIKNAEA